MRRRHRNEGDRPVRKGWERTGRPIHKPRGVIARTVDAPVRWGSALGAMAVLAAGATWVWHGRVLYAAATVTVVALWVIVADSHKFLAWGHGPEDQIDPFVRRSYPALLAATAMLAVTAFVLS